MTPPRQLDGQGSTRTAWPRAVTVVDEDDLTLDETVPWWLVAAVAGAVGATMAVVVLLVAVWAAGVLL